MSNQAISEVSEDLQALAKKKKTTSDNSDNVLGVQLGLLFSGQAQRMSCQALTIRTSP